MRPADAAIPRPAELVGGDAKRRAGCDQIRQKLIVLGRPLFRRLSHAVASAHRAADEPHDDRSDEPDAERMIGKPSLSMTYSVFSDLCPARIRSAWCSKQAAIFSARV
jgi:hypothetical protein